MDKGFNRLFLCLSGFIGLCFFILNIDLILCWDRSGGIIPFPAFSFLMLCSLILSAVCFFILYAMKSVFKWVLEGFTS